jgi:hypothetical protein
MAKIIRKQIDLTEDVLKGVKILAAYNDTNPKKYIEALIVQHVRASSPKVAKVT